MRREFRDLADPAEARDVVMGLDIGGGTASVPLADARGRVLAERVDATFDVPGFDRAAMDGYAVRARDTFGAGEADPVTLDRAGVVHAGEAPDVEVGAREAVEISTGAVLPAGADAVVIVERTEPADGAVAVLDAVAPGENVMPAGADIPAGARALGPGVRLTAREIGVLSALGRAEVDVRARPRVGIISTGDELVRPGEPLDHRAGQIHDVNGYAVAAGVEDAGGVATLYPHVGDDYDAMEAQLREAAGECDLLLTSGSTSASAVDVVYRVIEDRGELLLHGVAVKPGKPMLVGRIADAAYVGLPGYPVSALTIFRTFVAPALRSAAGLPEPATATVTGRMAGRERYAEGRLRFIPVGLVEDGEGDLLVHPVDKGSGATTSLVEADGVVRMAPDTAYLDADEPVDVELFSPDVRPPDLLGIGEADPAMYRLLDRLDRPRYLDLGSREARRRLDDGLPDVVLVHDRAADGASARLGGWTREWGIVVPDGNPAGVTGLADLVAGGLEVAGPDPRSSLDASLDARLGAATIDCGGDSRDRVGVGGPGIEHAARRVAAGRADAGIGLRATAAGLDVGFVPIGTESLSIVVNARRRDKRGVRLLAALLDGTPPAPIEGLPGYGTGA